MILTPLNPFYIVKLGFTGVYVIFLFSAIKLTSTHNLCFEQKYGKYQRFLSENFQFLEVKFSIYLNRHVFVMGRNSNRSTTLEWSMVYITKTRLCKYIENFTSKNWKFSVKNSDIFHISAQNIDCGYSLEQPRRGGSNGYPQSMFLSRSKKNNVYHCKPQFHNIK